MLVGSRPVLGTLDDIEDIFHSRVVDEVAICLSARRTSRSSSRSPDCARRRARSSASRSSDLGLTLPGGRVEEFDGIPVLSLAYGPDRAVSRSSASALLDVVLGAVALIVLAPVLLVLSFVDRGPRRRPVLFRQTRVGLHGRPFTVVKFRTMVPDAEARLAELTDPERDQGPGLQGHRRSAPDRGRAGSCGPPASTSCRSCGTSCAAR